jgi:hypothetical protein
LTANGQIASGAKVYFYSSGTTFRQRFEVAAYQSCHGGSDRAVPTDLFAAPDHLIIAVSVVPEVMERQAPTTDMGLMTALGQTEKSSRRAFLFRTTAVTGIAGCYGNGSAQSGRIREIEEIPGRGKRYG